MKKMLIFLLAGVVALQSCMWTGERIKGNGNVTTVNKQPGEFTGIELHSSYEVFITEGSPTDVKIEAEENLMPHIKLIVRNGVLNLETTDDIWLSTKKGIKIYVTSPEYRQIKVHSSGSITSQSKISTDDKMSVGCSGSGSLKLDLDAPEVNASVSGSGSMSLSGETKKFSGDVSGSGGISAMNLMSEESEVSVSGSGNADVYASVKLAATISGSGGVRYKGDAEVSKTVSGSGSVTKVN